MFIQSITAGPFQTNSYVIADNIDNGAIIDPTFDSQDLLVNLIEKEHIHIKAIYLTHSHMDHIAEVANLKEFYKCDVWIHKLDEPNLIEPGSDLLPQLFTIKGVKPDHYFVDGQVVTLGHLSFKVLHTPGHSPGGVCFYFEKEKVLISGDTLFKGSIGNLNFPTAEPEKMFQSLDRLNQLPKDTIVYPGHGESTILSEESWLSQAREIFQN
ncbi:MAG: MBL fold metallo-hydrolase [Rhabdochlamydiaceae bacterium]|nr:MBL fold metallo-hydrolase [Candidatus Amphrikana amoebophyrae]